MLVLDSLARIGKLRRQNRFRNLALAKAAQIIGVQSNFDELYYTGKLKDISGIGKGIFNIIDAVFKGKNLEYFIKDFPIEILDIAEIKSVGIKRARLIKETLGITTREDLQKAASQDTLLSVPGIGPHIQNRIKQALSEKKASSGKLRLDQALMLSEKILRLLRIHKKISDPCLVGDLRRGVEIVDTIEFVISGKVSFSELEGVLKMLGARDIKKIRKPYYGRQGIALEGCGIRIYRVMKKNRGAALILLTGSDAFIGKILKRKNLEINIRNLEASTEEAAFQALGLKYIPPEARENQHAVLSIKRALPALIELDDLCGVFHVHTNASDGKNNIAEMRQAARLYNLNYIAINDHSQSAYYAGGQSQKNLLAQIDLIKRLNQDQEARQCYIFTGIESDIRADGALDYKDKILRKLEIIIASVHNQLRMAHEPMTQRLLRAVMHPYTTILGHPTGRIIFHRPPSTFDFEKVLESCKENQVAIELNCQPARLDLNDRLLQIARSFGVLVAINPDAHSTHGFDFLRNGIIIAKRAGLRPHDVLNTMSLEDLKKWLKSRRLNQ